MRGVCASYYPAEIIRNIFLSAIPTNCSDLPLIRMQKRI